MTKSNHPTDALAPNAGSRRRDHARLAADFLRVRTLRTKPIGEPPARPVVLEVGVVDWSHPHTPQMRWQQFRRWEQPPGRRDLAAARRAALADSRFFRVCEICDERNNHGHMHDRRICQGCAEKHLMVVY